MLTAKAKESFSTLKTLKDKKEFNYSFPLLTLDCFLSVPSDYASIVLGTW